MKSGLLRLVLSIMTVVIALASCASGLLPAGGAANGVSGPAPANRAATVMPIPASTSQAAAGVRPISVSSVSVEVGVGSPIPVDAVVSGEWPNLCAQLAQITLQQRGRTFTITLLATATDPACPPDRLGLPFRIAIPLNTVRLPQGEYTVSANGATAAFHVPLTSRATPSADLMEPIAPQPMPDISFTLTPTGIETVEGTTTSPAPGEISARPVTPIAQAPRIAFISWSPSGKYLAYAQYSETDLAVSNPVYSAGTLHLVDVAGGSDCAYSRESGFQPSGSRVAWAARDILLTLDARGRLLSGPPCQTGVIQSLPANVRKIALANGDLSLFLLETSAGYWLYRPDGNAATPLSGIPATGTDGYSFAPGGKRLAVSSLAGGDRVRTSVVRVVGGEIEYQIEWQTRAGEGNLPGPTWLNDEQFLIQETLDQGPLLVTVGRRSEPIARTLFGLNLIPSITDANGVSVSALAAQGDSGAHLVLYGVGVEANFPPVRIFHPETRAVETTDFTHLWGPGMALSGTSLLLSRPKQTQDGQYEAYIRPLDRPGMAPQLIDGSPVEAYPRIGSSHFAIAKADYVLIYSLPDGAQVIRWRTDGFLAETQAFSPDGRYLAIHGYLSGAQRQALFIVHIP